MKKSIPSQKTAKAIETQMKEIYQKWQSKFKDKPHSKTHLFGKLTDDFIKLSYKAVTAIYDPNMSRRMAWHIDLEDGAGVDWGGLLKEIRKRKNELLKLCNRRTIIWIC
jgi:hypothetical protein